MRRGHGSGVAGRSGLQQPLGLGVPAEEKQIGLVQRVALFELTGGGACDLLDLCGDEGLDGPHGPEVAERAHGHQRDHRQEREEGEELRAERHDPSRGSRAPRLRSRRPLADHRKYCVGRPECPATGLTEAEPGE
jgi:hypothetical protein